MATNIHKMKETIRVKKANGEEIVLDVLPPSGKNYQEAQIVYAAAWRKAGDGGAVLKENLEDFLKNNGSWDDKKEKEKAAIFKEISRLDRTLSAGKMTLSKGKEISLEIIKKRNELRKLLEQRSDTESNTAESIAENARFNFLCSVCIVYNNDGSRVYKSVDEYMENMASPECYEAASKLATMVYGAGADPENDKREVKFLKKYKMMNQQGQLIRSDGKAVDSEGRLIDHEDRFIDEQGNYLNSDGERINKDGSPFVEEAVFLDDNGNPITDHDNSVTNTDAEAKVE